MIAPNLEWRRQSGEKIGLPSCAIRDVFPCISASRADDAAAVRFTDRLMAEAYTECRNVCSQRADDLDGDARLRGRARAPATARSPPAPASPISSTVMASLRCTTISAPSSPRYWTRLYVNES